MSVKPATSRGSVSRFSDTVGVGRLGAASLAAVLGVLCGAVVLVGAAASASAAGAGSRITLLEAGPQWMVLELEVLRVDLEQVGAGAAAGTSIAVDGLGRERTVDGLELPVLRRLVELPYGSRARASEEVLEVEVLDPTGLGLPSTLVARRPSAPKCDCDRPDAAGAPVGTAAGRFAAVLGDPLMARGRRLAVLTISPIRIDPARQVIEVARVMRVSVHFEPETATTSSARAAAAARPELASPHLDAALAGATLGLRQIAAPQDREPVPGAGPDPDAAGDVLKRTPWRAPGATPVHYLIVAPPWLATGLEPFVTWKTQCGYRVQVATTEETGATAQSIREYIRGRYESPEPPVFVLLVGDSPDLVPTFVSAAAPGGSDLPYAQIDDDLFPDLLLGRWPVDDLGELAAVIDKTLQYEQASSGDWWLNRALFVAGDGYGSKEIQTHQDVISHLFAPPPNGAETAFWSSEEATEGARLATPDLIADIDGGRAWVVYSAHSDIDGWQGPPRLRTADIPTFDNAGRYPVGIGCSCESNMWAATADAFGEAAVTAAGRGFVAYWGASGVTFWQEDDWLERGFFDSIFPSDLPGTMISEDRSFALAAACSAGLLEVTLRGSRDAGTYWHMYNLAGDPSLDPYTRQPLGLRITAPVSVEPMVGAVIEARVAGPDGSPVASALVGATQDDDDPRVPRLLGAALSDASGRAEIVLDQPIPGAPLRLVVTAHNFAPVTAWVAVKADGLEPELRRTGGR